MNAAWTDPSTRRGAAARGALAVIAWTAALEAFLLATRAAGARVGLLGLVSDMTCSREAFGVGPKVILPALLAVSALVGAALGLVARRVRARVVVRRTVLLLSAAPALWLLVGVTMGAASLPHARWEDVRSLLAEPMEVLEFVTVAAALAALPAALPAAMSVLVLEGWTRPANRGQGGLAHPAVRRWIWLGLATWIAALSTFAALRWPRR